MKIRETIILQDLNFWENISTALNVNEIRLLELIYKNKNYMFDLLINDLKKCYHIKISKSTARRIILKFDKLGLISLVKSKPLFINEVIGLEDNMRKVLIISKNRYQLK